MGFRLSRWTEPNGWEVRKKRRKQKSTWRRTHCWLSYEPKKKSTYGWHNTFDWRRRLRYWMSSESREKPDLIKLILKKCCIGCDQLAGEESVLWNFWTLMEAPWSESEKNSCQCPHSKASQMAVKIRPSRQLLQEYWCVNLILATK